MITKNDNEDRGSDITDSPTDEYPALREPEAASSLTQLEVDVGRLHNKWQSIELEFAKRESRVALLDEELKARETTIATLNADRQRDAVALDAANARVESKDAEISALVAERRAADDKVAALSQELADVASTHRETLEKLALAEAETERLNALVRQEQVATAGIAARNQEMLVEQVALQGKLQDLEIYINGRHDHWSALNAELAAHKNALLDMEKTAEARDALIAHHEEEKRQLAGSIRDLERQCSELAGRRKEREEAHDALQRKLAAHFAQAEQVKTEYAGHTKEMELAAKTALAAQQRIDELEKEIVDRSQQLQTLHDDLRMSHDQLRLAQDHLSQRTTQLAATQQALEHKSRHAEELSNERGAAQQEHARIRAELDALTAQAVDLGKLRSEAIAETQQLRVTLTAQQELIARLETELRAKQSTAEMLERSVDRITDLGARLAALDQQMNGGSAMQRDVEQAAHPADFAATLAADDREAAAAPTAVKVVDAELLPIDLLLDDEPNRNVVAIGKRTKIEAARKLVVTINGQVFDYPISKKNMTIGRGHDSDIRIASHFISRVHARIRTSDNATIIEDAGSKNGVVVNSERVLRRVLHNGDIVTLGDDASLRFVDAAH